MHRTVKLSNGNTYNYHLPWDGRTRLRGGLDNAIAFDTETEALSDRALDRHFEVPRVALATVSIGSHSYFLHPAQLPAWVKMHRGEHLVGQNVRFDFWVVDKYLRAAGDAEALEAWWEFPTAHRLHDTLLLDQLIRLAQGVGTAVYSKDDSSLSRRNLAEIAADYVGVEVDKQDPYRMRYGELLGLPSWEGVDEGFFDYAIRDAVVTYLVYRRQAAVASAVVRACRSHAPREMVWQAERKYGYLTEAIQTAGSLALQSMSRVGIQTSREKVEAYEAAVRDEMAKHLERMTSLRPGVFVYRDECTPGGAVSKRKSRQPLLPGVKREPMLTPKGKTPRLKQPELKAALEEIASRAGVPVLQSQGKKGGTSLSAKAWGAYAHRDPFLKAWATVTKKAKLLSFFDLFRETSVIHATYNPLMRSGRVSACKPNLQQCYSEHTELLTETGWRSFKELLWMPESSRPRVVQYGRDGTLQFVTALGWVDNRGPQLAVRLEAPGHTLVVTEDHRCLTWTPEGTYTTLASDVARRDTMLTYDGCAIGYARGFAPTPIVLHRSCCVTVPSGLVIVRHGGDGGVVSGNCPRDKDFRGLFVARHGHLLYTVDYSFIELRTLAATCVARYGKSTLADVIKSGRDPHTHTASIILGEAYEDVLARVKAEKHTGGKYADARQSSKALNFGLPGGLGPNKLAAYAKANYGVDMSVEDAARFRGLMMTEVYPELTRYLADSSLRDICFSLGVTERAVCRAFDIRGGDPEKLQRATRAASKVLRGDPFKADGTPYKESFVDRTWEACRRLAASTPRLGPWVRDELKREIPSPRLEKAFFGGPAFTLTGRVRGGCTYTQQRNTPFQGLAADGAKLALWRLLAAGFRILAFVHDEIIVELPKGGSEGAAREVDSILNSAMEEVLGHGIPSAVEGRLGECWQK